LALPVLYIGRHWLEQPDEAARKGAKLVERGGARKNEKLNTLVGPWNETLPRLRTGRRHRVETARLTPYRSGRSRHWVKSKNPAAPAVKREAEEDWGKER